MRTASLLLHSPKSPQWEECMSRKTLGEVLYVEADGGSGLLEYARYCEHHLVDTQSLLLAGIVL